MTLPLYMKDAFGYEAGLVLVTVIGFFFGFVLERAGFGRAENIVSQFYLDNMRVLKVMFMAVAVACLGLAALGGFGVLDLSAVVTPPSFLWPQVVGGTLVGVGMVVSGYCPGTSVVSAASGNYDGLATLGGIVVGSVLFGIAYPLFEGLYMSAPLNEVHLPELTGIPRAVLGAGVLLMAAAAFFGGEKVERIVTKRTEEPDAPGTRNRVLLSFGVVAVLGLATLGMSEAKKPQSTKAYTRVTALELAGMLVRDPSSFYIVDLRAPKKCKATTIPGAICLRADGAKGKADTSFIADLRPTRKLLLFGDNGDLKPPDAAMRYGGPVLVLAGGFRSFHQRVLTKPAPPRAPSPETLAEYQLRTALYGHFTGARVKAAAVTVKPIKVKRKLKKGGGC